MVYFYCPFLLPIVKGGREKKREAFFSLCERTKIEDFCLSCVCWRVAP